jgi:ubiquinone/menaquinone biosynthesis C-methylase UbiE
MLNDAAGCHKQEGAPVAPWKAMRRAFLLLCLSGLVCAQQVHPVTGRHIASVMGMGGADWLVRPEREAEEAPDAALDANDIQPAMLELLHKNIDARHLTNVETVVGAEDDPKLPAGRMDLVLLVDVYHEFSQPQKMLRKIRESLKSDGRMVLLEYRKEDPNVPIRPEHKMSVDEVRAEVQPEGFRFEKNLPTLPRQHILVFRKSVP